MSIIYKNLTYEELIKIAPKDKPFQVKSHGSNKDPGFSWGYISDNLNIKLLSDKSFIIFFSDLFDLIIDPWDNFKRGHFNEGDILEEVGSDDGLQWKLITKTWNNNLQDDYCVLKSKHLEFDSFNKDLQHTHRKISNPERKKTELSLKEIADKFEIPLNQLKIKE